MKKSWKIPAVAGIILIVFNIVFLAGPFHKTAVFWISDIVVALGVLLQIPIADMAFKENSTLKSKVYGWPILSVGLRYLAVLGICAVVFIIISAGNPFFPIWLPIIVYAVIYGAAAIGLIASDSARDFVEAQDVKLEDRTVFMRKLYAEAGNLRKMTSDREISGILTKVAEKIRFSDPTSCEEAFEQEGVLYKTFESLKNAVKAGNKEEIQRIATDFTQQLEIRNSICKNSK